MTGPGWHHATGDPEGTVRYWDGSQWVGEPVLPAPPGTEPSATGAPGFGAPPAHETQRFRGTVASFGRRALGRVADFFIGSVLFAIFIVSGVGGEGAYNSSNGNGYSFDIGSASMDTRFEYIVLGLFLLSYHVFFTHLAGGTPGKLMAGTRVVDLTTGEGPVSLQKAALRSVNYVTFWLAAITLEVGTLMSGVTILLGFASLVMLLADDHKRTVMDRIASTVVVEHS